MRAKCAVTDEEDDPTQIRHWHVFVEKRDGDFYFLQPKAESHFKLDEYLL